MQTLSIVKFGGHHDFIWLLPWSNLRPPQFSGRFDAGELFAKICDMLFANYPAGNVIEPHRYDTDKIGAITKVRLMLTVEGATTTIIAAGQLCFALANKERSA